MPLGTITSADFETKTMELLTALGVSEVSRGGCLLRHAVLIVASNPRHHYTVTELSELLAVPNISPRKVANSMRCAYEQAYKKTSFALLAPLMQDPLQKPKLTEFIAMSAKIILSSAL